jgi:hypothetical protein
VPRLENAQLLVETGINVGEEWARAGGAALERAWVDKNNGIIILSKVPGTHFIQFVTRQCLDHFRLQDRDQDGLPAWQAVTSHYTTDMRAPKWKVDVPAGTDTCFYDEVPRSLHLGAETLAGVAGREGGQLAIYDDPDLPGLTPSERITACTFVVTNNQVTHVVQWSKQKDVKGDDFYAAHIQACAQLPDWAVAVIALDYQQNWAVAVIALDYQQTNGRRVFRGGGFQYEPATYAASLVPIADAARVAAVGERVAADPAALSAEAAVLFLQPPPTWYVCTEYREFYAGAAADVGGAPAVAAGPAAAAGVGGVQHPILHAALQPALAQGAAPAAVADDRAVLDTDRAGVAGAVVAQREGDRGAEGRARVPSPRRGGGKDGE